MGDLKIGVALWSLGATRTEDELARKLDQAAELGLKGVQLWCVDFGENECVLDPSRCTGNERKDVLRMLESRGLVATGLCAQLAGPTTFGGFGEEAGLKERVDKTKQSMELALDLGTRVVTTHVGAVPEDRSDPAYDVFLRSCKSICEYGESIGAHFAMETGQETAEVLRRFIEDIAADGAKVNYDPANMIKHGTVEGVPILAPYIVHTHAKDRKPETGCPTVGEGAVPWDAYLAALRDIGYDGWYALEDESGNDVIASLKRGKAFLESKG
jgi:sugar phosphate isomerase/epimerase